VTDNHAEDRIVRVPHNTTIRVFCAMCGMPNNVLLHNIHIEYVGAGSSSYSEYQEVDYIEIDAICVNKKCKEYIYVRIWEKAR
jgi:hypothetical protein